MNKIINKFSFSREKFMPELHLEQSGFTYSACEPFTKHCERNKACLVYNAAYSKSKYLANRTISDKILKYRAYEIDRHRG